MLLLTQVSMAQEPVAASGADIDALFHKGEQAYNNGGYAKAVDIYTEVLAADPEYLNAYLQRGFAIACSVNTTLPSPTSPP
ncbi:MAG: hypothetical protein IPH00_11985 [Flavobacteriales bacterium]|nr:hypothetical protein [Flavobacteriales bacterium]